MIIYFDSDIGVLVYKEDSREYIVQGGIRENTYHRTAGDFIELSFRFVGHEGISEEKKKKAIDNIQMLEVTKALEK